MSKKRALLFIFLPLIIASCIVFGIFLGAFLTPSNANNQTLLFPQNQRFNTATKLNEILNFIEDTYVDSVDKKDITERSITSMLTTLDPHSYYIPAKEFDGMNDPLEGNFEGIGVEFRIKNDTILKQMRLLNWQHDSLQNIIFSISQPANISPLNFRDPDRLLTKYFSLFLNVQNDFDKVLMTVESLFLNHFDKTLNLVK